MERLLIVYIASLQLHIKDTHCRHVLIGCKPSLFMQLMLQQDFLLPEGKITFIKGLCLGDLPSTLVIFANSHEESQRSNDETSTIR